jgi:hypothetical protein
LTSIHLKFSAFKYHEESPTALAAALPAPALSKPMETLRFLLGLTHRNLSHPWLVCLWVLFSSPVILGQAKLEPRIQGKKAMFFSLSKQSYYH